MTITKQLIALVPLSLLLVGLVGYNFMSADWTNPTAVAPAENVSAPINIGSVYQAKLGDLGAVRMRAGEYCNADGTICFSAADVGGNASGTTSGETSHLLKIIYDQYGVPADFQTAPTGLSEWPNAIVCDSNDYIAVLRVNLLSKNTKKVQYSDGKRERMLTVNGDGSYYNSDALQPTCMNKSIATLCGEGRCTF